MILIIISISIKSFLEIRIRKYLGDSNQRWSVQTRRRLQVAKPYSVYKYQPTPFTHFIETNNNNNNTNGDDDNNNSNSTTTTTTTIIIIIITIITTTIIIIITTTTIIIIIIITTTTQTTTTTTTIIIITITIKLILDLYLTIILTLKFKRGAG